MNTYANPPFPHDAPPPDSSYTRRRRRRRLRRVVIGTEYGRWFEYRADVATPIHCQRLARTAPQTRQDAPQRPVIPAYREIAGATYAAVFMGIFGGLLTLFLLIVELL